MFPSAAALCRRVTLTAKTLAQFRAGSIAEYGLYRFGLWTGHYRRSTPPAAPPEPADPALDRAPLFQDVLDLPNPQALRQVIGAEIAETLREAGEIVGGSIRLFGGPPVPLDLDPPAELYPLKHWTDYERGKQHWLAGQDIKFLWEPARFGWVYPLARAFLLTADDAYAQAFWNDAERFLRTNPPNLGPQWSSAQEVALRLMALVFGGQVFRGAKATTPRRLAWLGWAIAAHAHRIPPTMVYARAQANNHLITEAAGLLTAALALPTHPDAPSWRETGRKAFQHALLTQIRPDGAYTQHSANYHRLMLEAALWVDALLTHAGETLPAPVQENLARASAWLACRLDPVSGRVPNLGHNDGAHILPLAPGGYADYRPAVQSAGLAFCGRTPLPTGPWDEMSLWLNLPAPQSTPHLHPSPLTSPPPTILHSQHSWAELRAVAYHERPAHADQLHVDLWWRGTNVAIDPGTYLYNAAPPWDNVLAATRVHNTVEIDGTDQMTRAGRFRWVDWSQAQGNASPAQPGRISATHTGYIARGVLHRRTLENSQPDAWIVTDELTSVGHHPASPHLVRLHWLLPDLPWQWREDTLELTHPAGMIRLHIHCAKADGLDLPFHLSLMRCGETLLGASDPDPIMGWSSPTYGQKVPSLSLSIELESALPLTLSSSWMFIGAENDPQPSI
jgi:hypothetical protein